MIFLYTILVILVGLAHFLIKRRTAALEKKYARVAKEADTLLRQPSLREGNSSRADPYQAAKRQYQLGLLVQKRDRVEAQYTAWQGVAERTGKLVAGLKNWKGRKLPYTLGVLDVAGALALVDYLGLGQYVNARYVIGVLTSLFNG
jgi:hypothetical protein